MLGQSQILLYVAMFIGVLLLVEGVYYLVRDGREEQDKNLNRRLRMIAQSGDARAALRKYRGEDRGPLDRMITRLVPPLGRLQEQAGSYVPPSRFALLALAAALLAAAASSFLLTLPALLDVLLGVLAGLALPVLILRRKRHKRIKRFGEQLPDAIELVVRALLAGHPTSAAIGLVAKEMPDPIGTEFGLAVDEMTYGGDLQNALAKMSERIQLQDLQFLVTTVQIQYHSGGNLAEVLSNLATVIRERFRMFGKVRAVSAEGRMSAVIVGGLPVAVAGAIHGLRPSYFGEIASEPAFLPMMGLAAVLVVVGWFVTWRMVNFKV